MRRRRSPAGASDQPQLTCDMIAQRIPLACHSSSHILSRLFSTSSRLLNNLLGLFDLSNHFLSQYQRLSFFPVSLISVPPDCHDVCAQRKHRCKLRLQLPIKLIIPPLLPDRREPSQAPRLGIAKKIVSNSLATVSVGAVSLTDAPHTSLNHTR